MCKQDVFVIEPPSKDEENDEERREERPPSEEMATRQKHQFSSLFSSRMGDD